MRVTRDDAESSRLRKEAQQAYHDDKQRKLQRTRHGSVGDDVKLANIFRLLGLANEFLADKERTFQIVPTRLEGRETRLIPAEALEFLRSDFKATVVDDGHGRQIIRFPEGEEVATVYSLIAKRSGQSQAVVKQVYAAILKTVRIALRDERKIRLPDLCIIKVDYRPAREKVHKKNPFTKKMQWFEAKPASNKLKFRPVKYIKQYVDNKVAVEAPKKKKK